MDTNYLTKHAINIKIIASSLIIKHAKDTLKDSTTSISSQKIEALNQRIKIHQEKIKKLEELREKL